MAPAGDRLFAVGAGLGGDGSLDEILCFDPTSLAIRFKFGRGRFSDAACGMAAAGDELFVGDRGGHRLQVFSLSGEHLRDINGGSGRFWCPWQLIHFDGRLYVLEEYGTAPGEDEDFDADTAAAEHLGRRVFVLTLAGDVLQVYKTDRGIQEFMHVIESRLVLGLEGDQTDSIELLALRGL